MGPVAARWSLSDNDQNLGELKTTPVVTLATPILVLTPGSIVGEVVFIDSYGNAVTSIDGSLLNDIAPDRLVATSGRARVVGLRLAYGDVPSGSALALINSCGRLELALNQSNAAGCLGLVTGQEVTVSWPNDVLPAIDPEATSDSGE